MNWLKKIWKKIKNNISRNIVFYKLNYLNKNVSNVLWTIIRVIGKIRFLFLIYFLLIFIGTLLLYSSWAQKKSSSFFESLFTAMSAFSVTGLSLKPTNENWTIFGQIVIALLIIVGGVGFFAIKIYFFNFLLKRKHSIFENELILMERGSKNRQSLRETIVVSLTIIFSLIIISSIIFAFILYFSKPDINVPESAYKNWGRSLRYGIFHAIASINNAGLDIFGAHSLSGYYSNYFLQVWTLILFVIGGIGYPVIYDIHCWLKNKLNKGNKVEFKFSLLTKLSLFSYFFIVIIGITFIIFFEISNQRPNSFWNKSTSDIEHYYYINDLGQRQAFHYGSKASKVWALIFSVFSSRNAGFVTFDIYDLSDGSLLFLSFLMFVGASPSSTGGGIRTTTLSLVIITIFSMMIGKNSTHAFKKKIKDSTITQAFVVFCWSIILITLCWIILVTSFKKYGGNIPSDTHDSTRTYNMIDLLFEVTSAFGTTGFSTGITNKLNFASQFTIVFLMFIGQLGISSTILIWGNHNFKVRKIEYIEEDILIG
ncbi:TrkH family potassium uptake protein [Mesomycoplasma neurolyticum]|uniref:Ktr system potassium uptake protein B n=1 Tax=Mesomycoplasma neurolyticum TaxID=2120 RepID=A0A449A5E7_9BACT|nr:potassium transporter TrkG [Mesomycoplasma neurolyticum]VEU59444.1 Ktr system potassium uptake protein B [Mesomycoplasma neurolyticum]